MRTLTAALAALALSATPVAANAAIYIFDAFLSGPNEFPPVASPGTGFAHFVFDDTAHTLSIDATWEDLLFPTTVAHIHAPTAVAGTGLATVATTTPSFPGFPVGVTSGSFAATFDMSLASSYRAGYLALFAGNTAAAEAALITAAQEGKAYFNIHSSTFTGGEIRGFLTAVPEPATWALMIAGFGLTGSALRSRRRMAVR